MSRSNDVYERLMKRASLMEPLKTGTKLKMEAWCHGTAQPLAAPVPNREQGKGRQVATDVGIPALVTHWYP